MTDQLQLGLDPRAELDAKISRILFPVAGETCPLSQEERDLLKLLQMHMGNDHAIPISRIADRLHLSPREIKDAARNLVVKLGLPIVGARQKPFGYFVAITPQELQGARNVLLSEVKALATRLVALGENEGRIVASVHAALKGQPEEGDAA
jgi:DNA-binding Lrp family transcriptional regulator